MSYVVPAAGSTCNWSQSASAAAGSAPAAGTAAVTFALPLPLPFCFVGAAPAEEAAPVLNESLPCFRVLAFFTTGGERKSSGGERMRPGARVSMRPRAAVVFFAGGERKGSRVLTRGLHGGDFVLGL